METKLQKFIAHVKKWEGGLSRHPNDSASKYPNPMPYKGKTGWHTQRGITYKVWEVEYGANRAQEFYTMTDAQWFKIFKKYYWDRVKGDHMPYSIAVYVTGIAWGSGRHRASTTLQMAVNRVLGYKALKIDGAIGPNTLRKVGECNERDLFDTLLEIREAFFRKIARPGTKNEKFLKGWLNRLEDYRKTFRPEE